MNYIEEGCCDRDSKKENVSKFNSMMGLISTIFFINNIAGQH